MIYSFWFRITMDDQMLKK